MWLRPVLFSSFVCWNPLHTDWNNDKQMIISSLDWIYISHWLYWPKLCGHKLVIYLKALSFCAISKEIHNLFSYLVILYGFDERDAEWPLIGSLHAMFAVVFGTSVTHTKAIHAKARRNTQANGHNKVSNNSAKHIGARTRPHIIPFHFIWFFALIIYFSDRVTVVWNTFCYFSTRTTSMTWSVFVLHLSTVVHKQSSHFALASVSAAERINNDG